MDKGWLIAWEWTGDAASMRDKVVNILPASLTSEEVAQYVERLYAQVSYNLDELLAWAGEPERNPYRVQVYEKATPERTHISCGHNPFLTAHPVHSLKVEQDEKTGCETITWSGIHPNGTQEEGKYTRKKQGAISFEPAWDRGTNTYRNFSND